MGLLPLESGSVWTTLTSNEPDYMNNDVQTGKEEIRGDIFVKPTPE